jgi:predicted nucleic acid-binding protein
MAKPRPQGRVITWLDGVDEDSVYLSVVTLAEIRFGVERLPEGRRRDRLAAWLEQEVPARFGRRILRIDADVAHRCGIMLARAQGTGTTVGVMDGFVAATAIVAGLTLVTRNVRHFERLGVRLIDPWNG